LAPPALSKLPEGEVPEGGAAHVQGAAAEHAVVKGGIPGGEHLGAVDGEDNILPLQPQLQLVLPALLPGEIALRQGGVAKVVPENDGLAGLAEARSVEPLGALGPAQEQVAAAVEGSDRCATDVVSGVVVAGVGEGGLVAHQV